MKIPQSNEACGDSSTPGRPTKHVYCAIIDRHAFILRVATAGHPRFQPFWLRIQSAVPMKLLARRWRSVSGTPVSSMAWSMQATH